MATSPFRQALLLTAGTGTRLRPLSLVRAKPAMPVAGEPLVRRIMGWPGAGGRWFHFVGVQAVEAKAFHSVTPGNAVNSIGDVYDGLIADRPGTVRGFVSETSFWDVGTVADYWRTSHALMSHAPADHEWK